MQRDPSLLATIFLGIVAIVSLSPPSQVGAAPLPLSDPCRQFPETTARLCPPFLQIWEHAGGLPIFGLPLADAVRDEATGLTVQWFERARFELPADARSGEPTVLLGLLGREATRGRENETPFRPAAPQPGCRFFVETSHNLCHGFLAYWERFGNLPVFGYPISEEFREVDPDTGQVRTVQYFERQQFEWYPGIWPERFDVVLGRLGALLFPAQSPAPQPSASVLPDRFGDGTHRVGADIAPGTYRNTADDTLCSWRRTRRSDGRALEIVSVTATFRQVVRLSPTDSEFWSQGCGTWEPATVPITPDPHAPFTDGVFIVGLDIAPGLWQATAPGSTCTWARLADFTGSPSDRIETSDWFSRRDTVRIQTSDSGFFTFGCGYWRRLGD